MIAFTRPARYNISSRNC